MKPLTLFLILWISIIVGLVWLVRFYIESYGLDYVKGWGFMVLFLFAFCWPRGEVLE